MLRKIIVSCIFLILATAFSSQAAQAYVLWGKHYALLSSSNNYNQVGYASYYSRTQMTASGALFNKYAMTAAHKTLPLNTYVKVTNLSNGRQVTVRINDRGPYVSGRIIDLSYAAAQKLGMLNAGVVKVDVQSVSHI